MGALVRRTLRVWPLLMAPLVTQSPPLRLTWGVPLPLTVTGAAPVSPLIVRVFEVIAVARATPLWSVKLKASGTVSSRVRTVQASLTPPTVTVAVDRVL